MGGNAGPCNERDIDRYLELLANDVGRLHLPYNTDDGRYPDGKENIKTGMLYFLAGHTEYSTSLINTQQ